MGVMRKAKRRVESLIAWVIAALIVALLGAGAWFVVMEVL